MVVENKYLKFSILLCFFNEEQRLKTTIRKILQQDYPADYYEIVAVDDGSIDGSVSVVEKFGILVIKRRHQGISSVRNAGLKHCKGEIILFLDSHIYLRKNALSEINKTLIENPRLAGVCGRYISSKKFDRNYVRDIRRQMVFKKTIHPRIITLRDFTTFSNAIGAIRKEVFSNIHFPVGFENSYGEDTYIQILAHNNNCDFFYNPSIVGIHDARIDWKTLLKKMFLEIRSVGNILFAASLEAKDIHIPYLHYFLSYPLFFIFTFISTLINPSVFVWLLLFAILLEVKDATKCFSVKNYCFRKKLESFAYLIVKESIQGLYLPYYLLFRRRANLKLLVFAFRHFLIWEVKKVTSLFV